MNTTKEIEQSIYKLLRTHSVSFIAKHAHISHASVSKLKNHKYSLSQIRFKNIEKLMNLIANIRGGRK